jgi:hypothetical protein
MREEKNENEVIKCGKDCEDCLEDMDSLLRKREYEDIQERTMQIQ